MYIKKINCIQKHGERDLFDLSDTTAEDENLLVAFQPDTQDIIKLANF